MIIESGKYYLGAWFIAWADGVDWLLSVWRVDGEPHFRFEYRFRYENSRDPFDPKDRKNWFEGTMDKSEAEVVAGARKIVEEMLAHSPHGAVMVCDRVLFRTRDPRKVQSKFARKSWAHFKFVDEEARK